ncbi:sce7726 family protein [Brucepastera parasyntrophica]|uniref:sce7726 family protein n=1 Tax=Brucepastera parasyntrophica TaxID=2880008 RepID=UPI00210918E2|nr:sce7726 family protein [Brucepastera parasyntrophica]ULQ60674.1 sce7726 family protein [Brucepastera parasyntrophica]
MKHVAQLSRIFTTTFARKIINGSDELFLNELKPTFSFINEVLANSDYELLYKNAFILLANDYRNEYIYKTVFYSQILEDKEKSSNFSVISELRTGNSIADIATFGSKRTSNSIEIKSDIDKISKATTQVIDYQKMFPLVSLISSKDQIDKIFKVISKDIGLLVLNNDLSINILRNAKYNDSLLDKKTMFYTLRRHEYELLIKEYYGYVPNVPNGLIFSECFSLAMEIPMLFFYRLFRKRLAERIQIEDYSDNRIPNYLTFIARKSSLTKNEKKQFIEKVLPH